MKKGFAPILIVITLLIPVLIIFAWSPWATEDFAKARVSKYHQSPMLTYVQTYEFGSTAKVPFGRKLINVQESFGQYDFFVSALGSVHTLKKYEDINPKSQEAKNDSSSEALAKDETANWKTYENTKYKYSVKYPPELDYQNLSRSQTAEAQGFTNGENDSYKFPEDKFIGISIKVTKSDLTLEEYMDKNYPENIYGIPSFKNGIKTGKIQQIIVNGYGGYKADNGMQFENRDKDVWIKKGEYIYLLTAYGNGETGTSYSEKAGIVFDQMLTTFKFTE